MSKKTKKTEETTKILFGSMWHEWPYYLSASQIAKVKRLYEKYRNKAYEYGIKQNLCSGLTCYKRINYPNLPIVVCFLACEPTMGGCRDFRREIYLCKSLKCPYIKECFSKGFKLKREKCKKMNLTKERNLVRKRYARFVLLHKIARGFKLDPLRTIKFLKSQKKKKEEDGKIQTKQNKKKNSGTGKRKKKKHKKSP